MSLIKEIEEAVKKLIDGIEKMVLKAEETIKAFYKRFKGNQK